MSAHLFIVRDEVSKAKRSLETVRDDSASDCLRSLVAAVDALERHARANAGALDELKRKMETLEGDLARKANR